MGTSSSQNNKIFIESKSNESLTNLFNKRDDELSFSDLNIDLTKITLFFIYMYVMMKKKMNNFSIGFFYLENFSDQENFETKKKS